MNGYGYPKMVGLDLRLQSRNRIIGRRIRSRGSRGFEMEDVRHGPVTAGITSLLERIDL